jgi:DNA modification methylase
MRKSSLTLPRGRHRASWKVAYRTKQGRAILGDSAKFLSDPSVSHLKGKVQLIFTSPPFPLRTKKSYGNLTGDDYIDWLSAFGALFRTWLRPSGSIVLELGNAWEKGRPTMSTLPTKAFLDIQESNNFFLCQEFICHNPARLPTPAEWVTVRRIRVKDSFTKLWWLAPTPNPKANNRGVLQEYSDDMKQLLARKTYSSGRRPSEHYIGRRSFLTNNRGAIPPSMLSISNTAATDPYQRFCREHGLPPHPARMPIRLAEFFIKFLTVPGDLVIDPFAGSNTTGAAAETLRRRWLSIEANPDYVRGSRGRFLQQRKAKG